MAEPRTSRDVSLGCGSLFLVTLIVWLVARNPVIDLQGEVQGLRREVAELKALVAVQADEARALRAAKP